MTGVLALASTLRESLRSRWLARARSARERVHDVERDTRERYLAAASDPADLERRQRTWERADPQWWG